MNKKLIALAVAAGLTAPMAANAAPTVYGHLQAEIASVDNDGIASNNDGKSGRIDAANGQSALSLADNKRGRLGIKGDEDLGGGLTALYKFEWQVDTATGDVNDGQRESWVGLKGNFGTIQAGRLKTAYKYNGGVKYDPFVTTYLEARGNGGMTGGDFGQNSFWDTSLSYKNKFGGVSLWVVYGVDEGDGTTVNPGNNGDVSAALKYAADGFEVFVASNSSDSDSTKDRTKVGGQFKSGAHTISAQYEMQDNANNDDTAFLGYQLKMGKNVLAAQLGQRSGDVGEDTDYMALGVIHKMSKKTRVFAGYATEETGPAEYSAVSAGLRIDF